MVQAQREATKTTVKLAKIRARRDIMASLMQASAYNPFPTHAGVAFAGATIAALSEVPKVALAKYSTSRSQAPWHKHAEAVGEMMKPFSVLGYGLMGGAASDKLADIVQKLAGRSPGAQTVAFDLAEGPDVAPSDIGAGIPFVLPPRGGVEPLPPVIPPVIPDPLAPQATTQTAPVSAPTTYDPTAQGDGQGVVQEIPQGQPVGVPQGDGILDDIAAGVGSGVASSAAIEAGRRLLNDRKKKPPPKRPRGGREEFTPTGIRRPLSPNIPHPTGGRTPVVPGGPIVPDPRERVDGRPAMPEGGGWVWNQHSQAWQRQPTGFSAIDAIGVLAAPIRAGVGAARAGLGLAQRNVGRLGRGAGGAAGIGTIAAAPGAAASQSSDGPPTPAPAPPPSAGPGSPSQPSRKVSGRGTIL